MQMPPVAPLVLARMFAVPLEEVAFRLRVSRDWLRHLARDPRHAHRVRIAELETIMDLEKAREGTVRVQAMEETVQEVR